MHEKKKETKNTKNEKWINPKSKQFGVRMKRQKSPKVRNVKKSMKRRQHSNMSPSSNFLYFEGYFEF